jgi:predicted AAA+ superfamily ATPase
VAPGGELVILDEAQEWPEVFPRLRGAIDGERSRNSRFLLLGSVAPVLMTQVSESLAGRLSLVALTPLRR